MNSENILENNQGFIESDNNIKDNYEQFSNQTSLSKGALCNGKYLLMTEGDSLGEIIFLNDEASPMKFYFDNSRTLEIMHSDEAFDEKNQDTLIISNINFPKITSMDFLLDRISSFESLQDNWDGYGACPLEKESANNAKQIISYIKQINLSAIDSISEYYPNPHGTISFEWNNGVSGMIGLEIGNHSMSYYIEKSNMDTIYYEQQDVNHENIKILSNNIKSFFEQ